MSNYDRFRNFQTLNSQVSGDRQKEFLTKSKSSRKVVHLPRDVEIDAVLTNSYKEGGDEFIMFTETLADTNLNVNIGDYIESESITYLVYSEYNHPMRNLWIKNRLIECNQTISYDAVQQAVYYIGSLRRYMDNTNTTVGEGIMLNSSEKPLLITKSNEDFVPGLRVMLSGETYKILEIDEKSNNGISYLSIEPDVVESQDTLEATIERQPPTQSIDGSITLPGESIYEVMGGKILAGSSNVDDTHGGYVTFSRKAQLVERTASSVRWIAPMTEGPLIVYTKDDQENILEIHYVVVM